MTARYTRKLASLARRAARLGMYIDITTPDLALGDWEGHGDYVLRDAESGYDCHASGVSLEFLQAQLDQIEREGRYRCPECDGWIQPTPDEPDPEREPVLRLVS